MITATAPIRVDLTGGFTDIPEVSDIFGGVALNLALDYRTEVTYADSLDPPGEKGNSTFEYRVNEHSPLFPERLLFNVHRLLGSGGPITVMVRSNGPRGCGLGSSASLAVAMTALAARGMDSWTIAHYAQSAERRAGNVCGIQDHIAAAFGGVNALELPHSGRYESLNVPITHLRMVETSCSLWLERAERHSGGLVEQILSEFRRGDAVVNRAVERLNGVFPSLRLALLEGNIDALIRSARDVYSAQADLSDSVIPRKARGIAQTIVNEFGGGLKMQGGGGTGAAVLVVLPESDPRVARLMAAHGYERLRFNISFLGVQLDDSAATSVRDDLGDLQ